MKPKSEEYEGHRVELRKREDTLELLIDGVRVRYGQLPGGLYFLDEYAYDWTDDLIELAHRFIDHRIRANKIRREHQAAQKEN